MKKLVSVTPTIEWEKGQVKLIDQTKLPLEEVYVITKDYQVVCDAIYRLAIRGAPAIGVAGAYACVLAANEINNNNLNDFSSEFFKIADQISSTRPTAVNLIWAVEQMKEKVKKYHGHPEDLTTELLNLANKIKNDDLKRCHELSLFGAKLISDNSNVMTICNTGGLATSGIGTALGVIQYAHAQEKNLRVYVCETRPLLQGSRLNTWELKRSETPFTLIADSMAATTMAQTQVDGIFVGADRIASNGDTANKIGTYSLAVLAKHHKVPFYVAAPLSTVDYNSKSGRDIPVEERPADELTRINGHRFTIENIDVATPAFDITPAELIEGIITEKGVVRYPYKNSLGNIRYAR